MSQSTVGDGHDMIYHIDNEDRFHSWQIIIVFKNEWLPEVAIF